MADATYTPKVYRKQGGSQMVIASSGTLLVESGGKVQLDSGSSMAISTALEVATGGRINLDSGSSMTVVSGAGLILASGSSFQILTDVEVVSAGRINLATGTSMTFASGSGLALASGSSCTVACPVEMAATGYILRPVVTLSVAQSTGTPLTLGAIHTLDGSSTSPVYVLPAGVAGVEVTVHCTDIGDTGDLVISCSAASATLSTSGADKLTIPTVNGWARFEAKSATRWLTSCPTSFVLS